MLRPFAFAAAAAVTLVVAAAATAGCAPPAEQPSPLPPVAPPALDVSRALGGAFEQAFAMAEALPALGGAVGLVAADEDALAEVTAARRFSRDAAAAAVSACADASVDVVGDGRVLVVAMPTACRLSAGVSARGTVTASFDADGAIHVALADVRGGADDGFVWRGFVTLTSSFFPTGSVVIDDGGTPATLAAAADTRIDGGAGTISIPAFALGRGLRPDGTNGGPVRFDGGVCSVVQTLLFVNGMNKDGADCAASVDELSVSLRLACSGNDSGAPSPVVTASLRPLVAGAVDAPVTVGPVPIEGVPTALHLTVPTPACE